MDIGQRIKEARLAAGLSQRQLCGDMITRNMLSLIENGSARPSMDTLRYFSARLGKSIGWFLDEPTVSSPNQQCMATARNCWQAGDHEGALSALDGYQSPDETFDAEKDLLYFLVCLSLAERALQEDRKPYALHLLEKAAQAQSPYITPAQKQSHQLLLARAGEAVHLDIDPMVLIRAEQTLQKAPARCLEILQAAEQKNSAHWLWLAGQAHYALQQYVPAANCLGAIEDHFPQAIPMLEICWRELGDFQKAYAYACKGRK